MWNVICGPRFLVVFLFIIVLFIVDTKRLEKFRSNFAIGEQLTFWKDEIEDVQDRSLTPPVTEPEENLVEPSYIDDNQSFQQEQFQRVNLQPDQNITSSPQPENSELLPTQAPIHNPNVTSDAAVLQQNSTAEESAISNGSLSQAGNPSMEYFDEDIEFIPLEGDEQFDEEIESAPLEEVEDIPEVRNETKTVAVVSLMTEKFKGTYMAHWVLIQSYCQRHNYTCTRFTGMEAKYRDSPYIEALELPKHWRKLIGVYATLKKFDYVLFLDVDNFILKPNLRVEDLFEDERTSLVFSGNPCFSSSHFFALKADPLGFDFLETWWQFRVFFRDNCHYDQGAFIMAMIALTSRYLHSAKDIVHINDDLYQCAAFVYGAREMTLNSMCSSYQRCLEDTCKKWIIPMGPTEVSDPGRIWLEENLEADFKNAGKHMSNLPISWNDRDWRKKGWDKNIALSLQGTRTTVFTDCRNTFSVHPVKKLFQLACEIAEPSL